MQIRVTVLPQVREFGTSGVSDSQKVPDSCTRKRSALTRIAAYSPRSIPSSRPTPITA